MATRIIGAILALSLVSAPATAGSAFHATVTGIPLLASISQGATCIGPDRAVTTRHGAVPYETLAVSARYDLRLVALPGCATPRFGTVAAGDRVTARGASATGAATAVRTTILKTHWGVCEPVYIPAIHDVAGVCTRQGKGYTYGLWLDAGGAPFGLAAGGDDFQARPWTGHITHGFSGGPVEDASGAIVGITAYGMVDHDGRHYAWAYPIDVVLAAFRVELASR